MAKNKTQKPAQSLQFAPSTFGQKAPPVDLKRVEMCKKFHGEMCDTAEDGKAIYPSKKAFIIGAAKAGFTAREIAAAMDKKPDTVHSVLSDERRRLRANAEKARKQREALTDPEATEEVEEEEEEVGEEDELEEDEEEGEEEEGEEDEL